MVDAFSGSPILSLWILSWASSRSAGFSHRVVKGVFGRSQKPAIATAAETEPSMIKSLKGVSRCGHGKVYNF